MKWTLIGFGLSGGLLRQGLSEITHNIWQLTTADGPIYQVTPIGQAQPTNDGGYPNLLAPLAMKGLGFSELSVGA